MRTTNIRFSEKRKEDERAWDILHRLEELNCKSQSVLVVRALNVYYDQHLKKRDDPYFETREKEDAFVERIIEAVEKKVFSMLPTMMGMAYMQQMAGMNGNAVRPADNSVQTPGADYYVGKGMTRQKEESKNRKPHNELLTETDDVEENEFLDTDLF